MLRILGFDTETTPIAPNLSPLFKCCSFYSENPKLEMVSHKPSEVKNFFLSLDSSCVFVTLSLQFDWLALNQAYDFKDFKITAISLSGKPSFIILKRDTHIKGKRVKITLTFLDLGNFVEGKLEKIAETFKTLPKLKCDLNAPYNSKELGEYCLRDSQIQYSVYSEHFFVTDRRYRVKVSIPSIAYQSLLNSIPVNTINNKRPFFVKKIERESYYGGRNEIFSYREKRVKMYDINSLYPYAMSIAKIPVAYDHFSFKPKLSDLEEIHKSDSKTYIVRAHIFLTKPLLPVRLKNKLIFPVGEITGIWSEPDFIKALPYMRVLRLKYLIVYKAIKGLFSPFVNEHYSNRLKSERGSIINLKEKLIMNSSYGKFAQRSKKSKELTQEELRESLVDGGDYFDEKGIKWRYRHIGSKWIKEHRDNLEAYGKFTAIASIITATARQRENEGIFKDKPSVHYCDTDSVITERELPISNSLGDFKLEKEGIQKIIALKFYYFANEFKSKGIPKNAVKVSEDSNQIVFTFDKVLKIAESVKQNLKPFSFIRQTKIIRKQYDKGYVVNDKVYPFFMLNGKITNHHCLNLTHLKRVWGELIW